MPSDEELAELTKATAQLDDYLKYIRHVRDVRESDEAFKAGQNQSQQLQNQNANSGMFQWQWQGSYSPGSSGVVPSKHVSGSQQVLTLNLVLHCFSDGQVIAEVDDHSGVPVDRTLSHDPYMYIRQLPGHPSIATDKRAWAVVVLTGKDVTSLKRRIEENLAIDRLMQGSNE